jgi:3-deoxy-D-manno-octulosonic-acid transferase
LLLRALPAGTQLICAPRKPEWFDQAAQALPGCVRRSQTKGQARRGHSHAELYLLDTIGELRQAYALADVVVIGRSFGTLHGSDMIEPIALGKPTIVGPAVSDFQDAMDALLAADGVVQTTADELPRALGELLMQTQRRSELASNGRRAIRAHQGATEKTAELIMSLASR